MRKYDPAKINFLFAIPENKKTGIILQKCGNLCPKKGVSVIRATTNIMRSFLSFNNLNELGDSDEKTYAPSTMNKFLYFLKAKLIDG